MDSVELHRYLIDVGLRPELHAELAKLIPVTEAANAPAATAIAKDVGLLPQDYARFLSEAPAATIAGATLFADYFALLRAYRGFLSWFKDDETVEVLDAAGSVVSKPTPKQLLPVGSLDSIYFLIETNTTNCDVYRWRHDERGFASRIANSWADFTDKLTRSDVGE